MPIYVILRRKTVNLISGCSVIFTTTRRSSDGFFQQHCATADGFSNFERSARWRYAAFAAALRKSSHAAAAFGSASVQ